MRYRKRPVEIDIYEGTTIVRENGIYRTEHRNG